MRNKCFKLLIVEVVCCAAKVIEIKNYTWKWSAAIAKPKMHGTSLGSIQLAKLIACGLSQKLKSTPNKLVNLVKEICRQNVDDV